jgi:hypothetical protein
MPRLKILLFIYAKLTVQILNKYGRNIISDSTILKETIKKDLNKKNWYETKIIYLILL